MPALWRTFQLGYRAEPRLLLASLATTVLTMLPDALLALWLKLLTDGVIDGVAEQGACGPPSGSASR